MGGFWSFVRYLFVEERSADAVRRCRFMNQCLSSTELGHGTHMPSSPEARYPCLALATIWPRASKWEDIPTQHVVTSTHNVTE